MRQADSDKQNLRHANPSSRLSTLSTPASTEPGWNMACRPLQRIPTNARFRSLKEKKFRNSAGKGWLQVLPVHAPKSANPKKPTLESWQQVDAILSKACWNELCKAASKSAFILPSHTIPAAKYNTSIMPPMRQCNYHGRHLIDWYSGWSDDNSRSARNWRPACQN